MNATTQAAAAASTGQASAAPAAQPAPDPFAKLPIVTLGETKTVDLTAADVPAGPPRKYEKLATAAVEVKSPMQIGWKHERAVFVPGKVTKELRPTSVHGTIVRLVNAAGKAGINAIDLVVAVRQECRGNKRSVFCNTGDGAAALPAVGWAEGWINSAVTRGLIGTHATKQAPTLRAEPKPEAAAGDGKATGTNG